MTADWQHRPLGSVVTIDRTQGVHVNLPYVGLEDIEPHTGRHLGSLDPRPVKSTTFKFDRRHVLYGRLRTYLNKWMLPEFEGHCSTEIFPLLPAPAVSREWLAFWLATKADAIDATSHGARMPRARIEEVLQFKFPVPPLDEQQRIVTKLDELLSAVAEGLHLRQAVVANLEKLSASVVAEALTSSVWPEVPLGEICAVLDSKRKPVTKKDRVAGSVPYYGASGVQDYIRDYIFDEKLVLLGEDGAKWSGGDKSSFIVDGPSWVNNHAHVLRPDTNLVMHEWLVQVLNSADLTAFVTGVTVPKLNQARMRDIPIPLPPVSEQQEICSKIQQIHDAVDEAVSRNARMREEFGSLRVQALSSAFNGEL